MSFELPKYINPDFSKEIFIKAADIKTAIVEKKGVAPQNFHATTIFPEYFKIKGKWILAQQSRMDSVVVVKDNYALAVTEPRRLEVGDSVVLGRTEDCTDGIYVHSDGFSKSSTQDEVFSFRTGRSRETSYSRDYDKLYDLLKYEKQHGYVVWVLGPAVVFDSDSRKAMSSLVEQGFVDAVFAGNALATHDMEGSLYKTALGQDIYTQASYPNGHYHHLDVINKVRDAGSIKEIVDSGIVNDGVIYSCVKNNVPFVLAGSIRDDGPLPEVIANVYDGQNEMREHTRKATTVISLATQLHSIASGNMTPSYQVVNGMVRPVYIYSVDISEFAVNKLRDRGTLAVTSIVTNVQDFLVNLERNLTK